MRQSRFSYAFAIVCSAIMLVPLAAVALVERSIAFIVSLYPASPDKRDFGFRHAADRHVAFAGDCPVSPFISTELRHEAGLRRLT